MPWPESWLSLPRTDEPEDIDNPSQPFTELERSMQDVAWSNRLFGGTQTIVFHVARLLRDVPPGTAIRILDIATGSADIPNALLNWGARRGLDLTIVGVDNHAAMLQMAQASAPNIHLVQADALALPFPPRSFDLALCALAFHHLGFDASARLLTVMDRLTTRGFVVSDLRRDYPTLWGVNAAMAAVQAHPFTRHDAPASVRRAFTPPEYRKMVGLSGVQQVRLSTHWYFRVALVQAKSG
ncbi:MAG: methyltransferase domain-containing protein [Janthinobacterium lividum]